MYALVPHVELILRGGLDWAICRQTLDDFNGGIKLFVEAHLEGRLCYEVLQKEVWRDSLVGARQGQEQIYQSVISYYMPFLEISKK